MKPIQWLVTCSPRLVHTHAPSAISGWKRHAIIAEDTETISSIDNSPALCGLRAKHGWAEDLFIEDHCKRCELIAKLRERI
jgi:hypothetical protein